MSFYERPISYDLFWVYMRTLIFFISLFYYRSWVICLIPASNEIFIKKSSKHKKYLLDFILYNTSFYKRSFIALLSASYPGFSSNANMFFLYASTPG